MTEHEHDVPPRPAFVLQVRTDPSGAPTAWLDDEQITVPPGVGIHRALIRAARRRADRTQPGHTIRVAGMTPDGATFHLAIGPDGEAWEVPPPEMVAPTDDTADDTSAGTSKDTAAASAEPAGGPVPDEISHVIELQDREEGLVGLVDDEEVSLTPGTDPYDQLLREARRRADRHAPGETVRVLGRTPGSRVWHIALTPDGTPQVVAPVQQRAETRTDTRTEPRTEPMAPVNAFRPADPAPAVEEPEPQPAYALEDDEPTEALTPPTQALTDDHGRPIPTTTAPSTAPHGFDQPAAPAWSDEDDTFDGQDTSPEPEPAGTRDGRGPSRRSLLLGGAGAVVLAGAAAAGFFALRSDGDGTTGRPTPTVSGTPLPDSIRPPAGLPASYLWSVVKISDVSPQLVVTAKQLVVTVDNDTTGGIQLVSLDPASGKSQWKADLPVDAVVADGPALVPIDGTDLIVLTTQTQIIAYPLAGGDPKTWPLEQKWSTALAPSGVIVTKPGDRKSAYILYGDKLTPRVLPTGTNPVAVLADGTLVATNSQGKVWLSKDATTAPEPHTLKAPSGTTPGTFIAATRDQLITAFVPKNDPKASRVRTFSLPQLQPRITTAPIEPAVFPANFMLAPDETWAVAGNTWVDMTTGDSHIIAAKWSPIGISQFNSWSKSGDNVLTATNRGKSVQPAKQSNGQVAVPKGGTAKVAYCVASIGSDTTLYAVPIKG